MKKNGYLGSGDLNKLLPKETAELFKIVNLEKRTSPIINFHKIGRVDFRTLTINQAASLVSKGATFIERKSEK